MNTTATKIILCYGDSNTHGQIPATYSRYPATVRWTGVLQNMLGGGYEVVEEGLGGRTVNQDDPERAGRNGYNYFVPCLSSCQPIDTVVIMLGTNDLKVKFHCSTEQIVDGLKQYITSAKQYTAKVLLIAPAPLNLSAPEAAFFGDGHFDEESEKKSEQLVTELKLLASELDCKFIAADEVAQPGVDGIHLDEASHYALAKEVAQLIGQYDD